MRLDIDQLVEAFAKVGLDVQHFPVHGLTNGSKPHTYGSIDLNKIVDAVNTVLEPELTGRELEMVAIARHEYCDDDTEIDDKPMLSRSEKGAFVSAWVWVDHPKQEGDVNGND